jgi:hypothetical protein
MNSKIALTAILATACTLGTMLPVNAASTYQVFKPNQAIIQPKAQLKLAPLHVKCAAFSSPEFVHDGLLTNDGARTIPAGTKLDWSMGGHSGKFTFPADLAHNQSTSFDLHFTTSAASPCTATFVQ